MKKYFFTSLIITALFSSNAFATIVSGEVTGGTALGNGGVFVKLDIPFTESNPNNTVGKDNFNTANLYGFDEEQNINLLTDLNVDILAGTGASGVITAGTTVASHYIFFDPLKNNTQKGSVLFDAVILGIITSKANLNASDHLLNNSVTYLNPNLRGLENGDNVSIVGSYTMNVDWTASTPGDYVRVLTAYSPGVSEVPVPAALFLFAPALLGFMGLRRKAKVSAV